MCGLIKPPSLILCSKSAQQQHQYVVQYSISSCCSSKNVTLSRASPCFVSWTHIHPPCNNVMSNYNLAFFFFLRVADADAVIYYGRHLLSPLSSPNHDYTPSHPFGTPS